jgi:glyoxylase-like metal-dependent hydrolase (beta-lactamase superfamily II)
VSVVKETAMNSAEGTFRFNVGEFNCIVFRDGTEKESDEETPALSFVNATDDEVLQTHRAYSEATGDPADVFSMNVLLIDTGDHRVLVDTGCGPASKRAGTGYLLPLLEAAGISTGDIDTVIITHSHWDHVDGNTDGHGNPTFPNARYVISQVEWDNIQKNPSDSDRAQILPIADRFDRISTDAEIVPGVRAIPAPGHTLGQIALLVESDGQRLLHTADVFHHGVELYRPEWYFDFDADSDATVTTRREIFDMAAREHLPVMTYHMAFPGLGHIELEGNHYTWRSASS